MKKLCAVLLSSIFVLASCHNDAKMTADAVYDRAAMPGLDASVVTTLISDSGITRYRITTETWQIFDKAQPVYWEFPDGIYMEKFNEDLDIDTWLRADYAHYDEDAQLWELHGNVRSMNADSEFFETPQLFWNQKTERIFSDSNITITREASIIKGVGFDSNQEMTKYTILNPTGVFPIKDE